MKVNRRNPVRKPRTQHKVATLPVLVTTGPILYESHNDRSKEFHC